MKLTYAKEDLESARKDLGTLHKLNSEETGAFPDEAFLIEPNWVVYQTLQDSGVLDIYTVRTEEGVLVGYMMFIIHELLHYKDSVMASTDVLFLRSDLRRGLAGYKLIKFALDDVKKTRKVDCISLTMSTKRPFVAIAERLGFKHREQIYHLEV